ncbi:rhamnose-binding lectin-like [Parambassis ranga]|uniref:Rhamnose-binding lectin-like n=1 Tax=Parambassis ranga TaxID=210632 RepID=A0A6P7IAQ0_9TELE|nr:rhamnose-binding lectin-like [Parambassis ranga]
MLCIIVVTLLLEATPLLVNAEMVTTCESNVIHRLSCDTGVISVQAAVFGRADSATCSEGTSPQTDCSVVGTIEVIKKRCDGKKVCELNTNIFSLPDSCSSPLKYLQTKYNCIPAIHQVTCEHSLSHLQCDEGQVIFVYAADYGRRDRTTCSYTRPESQIQNTDCSSPTNKVAESCNGKNSCVIKAKNSEFGDPCYGTYKYLEVAYACQYPEVTQEDTVECICPVFTGSSKAMLCFRLSTALLLAAAALLTSSVVHTERVISCDDSHNVQRLSCETGVISVEGALYGRKDRETCSEGRPKEQLVNTECSQPGTLDLLKRRCNGKRLCEYNTNVVRTADPCPGIFKYLETNYTCLPAIHLVVCEHSLADLYCDDGQVIFIYGADYGRSDRTTCSYKRPASQIENLYCSDPTRRVSDSCNGRNRCTVRASNAVFGDPCVGTYKYLEVAYVCEYPGLVPEVSTF